MTSDELEHDLKQLVETEEDRKEQSQFDELASDTKLERLQNLVKKSEVYAKIIAEQILQNTNDKKQQRHAPGRKRQKTDILGMLSKPKSDTVQPKAITGGKLKEYQLDGLEWLITLYENGLNGILADEMGLGKTLQCIAFIAFLMEQGISGPYLVVAPLSTVSNWEKEFANFAPKIKVVKYVGTKAERPAISFRNTDVVLTSYELSIKDFPRLREVKWQFLIIDEGHRLKNIECLLIQVLKKLNVTNRLLITGTPLQNNLNELWSLLNFILPDIFHDLHLFQQWFNFDELINLKEESDAEVNAFIEKNVQSKLIKNLHTILKPFILRRLKKDVMTTLPPKKEYLIHLPLTDYQKHLYHEALNGNLFNGILELYFKDYLKFNLGETNEAKIDTFLKNKREGEATRNKTFDELYNHIVKNLKGLKLQNMVMQLRNICNSPYIYYEPFPVREAHLTSNDTKLDDIETMFIEQLLHNSSKFKVLDQLLNKLLPQHKVLIFSQFTKTLDLLNDYLTHKGIGLCRFDGSTSQEERDVQIKEFKNPDNKVFLLSTRSGGLGINLIEADTVIIFDNDWNPQVDLQAIDRSHRIGQTKPVKIFRFLMNNSIEEILIVKNYSRRFLEKVIIAMGEFKFNKIVENNLASFNKEYNNLISLSKRFGFNGEADESFKFDYRNAKSIAGLATEEIKELTDRSNKCYSNFSIDFPHISLFETINKLDDE